jgi:hypothetical protein
MLNVGQPSLEREMGKGEKNENEIKTLLIDSPEIKMNLSPSKILMKLLHSLSCIEILWCRQGGDSILINFKYNGREFNLICPESNPIKYLRYL